MARGNQREKAREKNLKDAAGTKKKNTMTGSEQMRAKDEVTRIMQQKQATAEARKQAEAAAGGKK